VDDFRFVQPVDSLGPDVVGGVTVLPTDDSTPICLLNSLDWHQDCVADILYI